MKDRAIEDEHTLAQAHLALFLPRSCIELAHREAQLSLWVLNGL